MYHLVARALPGQLLFTRWSQGLRLWEMLTAAFPEAIAVCVMPDHVHLVLPHDDPGRRFARVRSGYSRFLGRPIWQTAPAPEPIADADHLRRTRRYVVLNPDRAGLVVDPLAWPLSTHRDRVGFAARPVTELASAPEREHAWISADPSVRVEGTPLPRVRHDRFDVVAILAAVCGVCRAPTVAASSRPLERRLFLQTAWLHEIHDTAHLAKVAGCSRRRVFELVRGLPARGATLADPALNACVRAVGDERFYPLDDVDLRRTRAWWKYRDRR